MTQSVAQLGRPRQRPLPKFETDRPVWAKQPTETNASFGAFKTYLELGDERTTGDVAKILDKSHSRILDISSQWGWQARVEAFEDATRTAEMSRIADARRKGEMEAIERTRANSTKLDEIVMSRIDEMTVTELARLQDRMDARLMTRAPSGGSNGTTINVATQVNTYDRETAIAEIRSILDHVRLTPEQQARFAERVNVIQGSLA